MQAALGHPLERSSHLVQFYRTDAFLLAKVAEFLRPGLAAGRPAIVIATPEHRADLAALLGPAAGGVRWLDARATLERFMTERGPDAARFEAAVGSVVRAAARDGPVYAFGEMVSLLVDDGRADAADALEGLWNVVGGEASLRLFCAYSMHSFPGEPGAAAIAQACASHGTVLPAEGLPSTPADLHRYVALLQQRSHAFAAEAAARRQAQAALAREREELSDFLENAIEGLHRVDGNGIILWANQAELDMLGHTRAEYVGQPIARFHADAPVIADILERAHRGEPIRDQAARLLCKDGSLRHVLINSNSRFEGGKLLYTRCFTRDVTDRVRLREERERVADAQRKATEVLESVTDGYLHIGPDWRITFANIGAGREVRRERPEMVGSLFWDAFPHVRGTTFEAAYLEAMATRQPRTFEAYYEPVDTWFENRLFPAGDGLALYYRDVTANRRVQRQLQGRNAQQAAVARLGQEATAARGLDALFAVACQAVAETLKADLCTVLELSEDGETFLMRAGVGWPDGFIGAQRLSATASSQAGYTLRRSEPVVVADLRTETRFQVQGQLRGQGAVSGMSVIVHGPQAPWGILGCHTLKPRIFDEDDVNFLQAVANLLTAAVGRAAAEAALRRRSRQQATIAKLGQRALADRDLPAIFAAVVEDVVATLRVDGASILELEADGATLVRRAGLGWGDAAAAYPVQEGTLAKAILDSPAPLVVPDLRSAPHANPEAVGRLGLASLVGVSLPGPGRPWGMLGATSRTARHFNEDEVNFLQALANLLASALERSRAEAELRRHREDLEGIVAERTALLAASNRELEAFSYTVSHDLRSPLRSIDGMSKILLRKHAPILPAEAQTLLGHVADGAVRMGKLIESVLTLSRLSRVTLQPVPIDLTAMASGILARHAAQEPARAVVWGVAPNLTLAGDEGLVRIVLENLLDNAWKFTSKTPDARIWVEPLPEAAGFRVRDNGAGFAMAHAAELFQPFHRLQAEFTGTGIGLATVRRIVQLHGGRVWAHAQPGQGATFHVALGGGAAPS